MKTKIIAKGCEYTCFLDEIPYTGTGFFIVERCPIWMRSALNEYAAYKMSNKGAKRVLLSTKGFYSYLPASVSFGKLNVKYRYEMLLLCARIPSANDYSYQIRLVPIKEEELSKYLAIHNEIFEGVDNASFSREQDIQNCYNKSHYEIMFAMTKDGIVGICEYDSEGKEAIIETIGILPEYRRKGFAKILLKNIFYILASEGVVFARLIASSTNKAGLSLYSSFGFHKERTLSKWYEYIEG